MKPVHPKVKAAGVVGAIATLVVWGIGETGLTVSPDAAIAIGVLATAGAGWLKSA